MSEEKELDFIATLFSALGHQSRLLIIKALAEKEHCVCELKEIVGSEMPTVSKHLSVLKNAGIVDSRKQNNQVYYRLILPCTISFINCLNEKFKSKE
jgi:ArsR family transcriptional regulator